MFLYLNNYIIDSTNLNFYNVLSKNKNARHDFS